VEDAGFIGRREHSPSRAGPHLWLDGWARVQAICSKHVNSAEPPGTTADYQVKLDIFEGPLDLLLYLVRHEEVELYDLSLERLIQQYLDYLAAVPQLDLERAGDFIAMAAHLIYLKSRRLLPPDQQAAAGDEIGEEEDPHFELIRQLIEYKKFKDVARHLQAVEVARFDLFARPPSDPPAPSATDEAVSGARALRDIGIFDLFSAFQRVLARLDQQADESQTVLYEENFTVAEKIEHLRAMTAAAGGSPVAFSALFAGAVSRVEVVVTFLALLELVRLRQLRVVQPDAFAEILIYDQAAGGAAG
jgi:segregation and condensation protein A